MKLPQHPFIDELKKLKLPPGDFAVFGGGPMWAHGLRDKLNDLDIVTRGAAWDRALELGKPEKADLGGQVVELAQGNIEVFNFWGPGKWNIDELIDEAEVIDGIRFVRLSDVMKWKKLMGRAKDLDHIKLIEQYMHN